MNFNNSIFALVLTLASGFASPVIAEDSAGIFLRFSGNGDVSAYPEQPPFWKTHVPADIKSGCLLEATQFLGRTITCDTGKKTTKFRIEPSIFPLSRTESRKQYLVTLNSAKPVIIEKENPGPSSTDIGLSLLWFYAPGIALFLASIFSETKGDSRQKIIVLYIAVTATAVFSALIGTATSHQALSIGLGGIAGWLAGRAGDNNAGTSAGVCIGLTTGGIASISGWEDGAITEYLIFLVAVCFVGFLLRELTAIVLDRNIWKKKIKLLYHRQP